MRCSTTAVPAPPTSTSHLKSQSRPISRSTSSLSYHSSFQIHQHKVHSPDSNFDFGSRGDEDQDTPTRTQTSKSSVNSGVCRASADKMFLDFGELFFEL